MGSAWVGEEGGGAEIDAAGLPYHIYWRRVWGREGEGREKREQICPCTKCSLHACSFTLCLSFSYLRSAVAAFRYKKVPQELYNCQEQRPMKCLLTSVSIGFNADPNPVYWCPKILKCPSYRRSFQKIPVLQNTKFHYRSGSSDPYTGLGFGFGSGSWSGSYLFSSVAFKIPIKNKFFSKSFLLVTYCRYIYISLHR